MPTDTQAARAQFADVDADIAALRQEQAAVVTPPFSTPLPARQYNVTARMLERVIGDLSGGQVEAELPKLGGSVERLPPEAMNAIIALYQFTGDERFEPSRLAQDPEAFGNLAGVLSTMRSQDVKPAGPDPTVVTEPELAAADDANDAARIAAELG